MKTQKRIEIADRLVYESIIRYKIQHVGETPALADLASSLGCSTSTVLMAIRRLAQSKMLTLQHEKNRPLKLMIVGSSWTPPPDFAYSAATPEPCPRNRTERTEKCRNCNRPLRDSSYSRRGLCGTCYAYKRRRGINRPKDLINIRHWCDCGQPAVEQIQTTHGSIHLCADCLALERSK